MSTLNNTVVAPSLTPNTPAQPQPVMQQPMQQMQQPVQQMPQQTTQQGYEFEQK